MLNEVFTTLIVNGIVTAGKVIKIYDLDIFAKNNFDITPEQYVVLNTLKKNGACSQNKLCQLLFKDKSNIARLVSILEEKKYIQKEHCPAIANRANKVDITKEGEKIWGEITPIIDKARKSFLENVTQDEMYATVKVLSTIQENLKKE